MTIVVDTNVLISGIFFGGAPWRVVNAVSKGEVQAAATPEIVGEYIDVVDEMIARGQGHLRKDGLDTFAICVPLATRFFRRHQVA